MSFLSYKEIKAKLNQWQPTSLAAESLPVNIWTKPVSLEHGLFTTNLAFQVAKKLGQKPVEVVQVLQQDLNNYINANQLPLETVAAGPYLNLKLKSEFYPEFLNLRLGLSYADYLQNEISKENRKVLLDYISPNVAKPLHAGHVRNADIGEAIRRLLKLTSTDLLTDNHWADWGVQFGIMFWGWKQLQQLGQVEVNMNGQIENISLADYDKNPIEFLVKVYVWANQNKDAVPNWDQLVRDEFIKLEEGDEENHQLRVKFLEVSQENMRDELKLLNVPPHDLELGESHYEADVKKLTSFLEEHNIWKKEEKARFFDFENLVDAPGLPPELAKQMKSLGRCYLISSNGYTSYAYRDVAARWNWARDYQRDLAITITGNEQIHHFKQVFAIIAYLVTLPEFKEFVGEEVISRLQEHNLVHLSYGFLNLPEGKMSTRKGNILRAKDLINQIVDKAKTTLLEKNPETPNVQEKSIKIAVAALKWFDLNRDTTADIILNIPQILAFEGNTGVYQLYTYARLRSILRKANKEDLLESADDEDFNLNSDETQLLQQIYAFPEIVQEAALKFKPHLICTHLYDLATKVNQWYNSTSILKESDSIRRKALLKLVDLICANLAFGLDLLAIEVLEEM
ncbi:MAG: arginine--tRNA ligase [Patescibacteria group bacterium]